MDVALNQSIIKTASAMARSEVSDAAQVLVLKKALDAQAGAASTLLQALPPAPPLATSGSLGTQVNTYA